MLLVASNCLPFGVGITRFCRVGGLLPPIPATVRYR